MTMSPIYDPSSSYGPFDGNCVKWENKLQNL